MSTGTQSSRSDAKKDHKWKSHDKSAEFKRVLAAVNPDIVSIQEINWSRPAQDVGDILDEVLPLANGEKWRVHSATDCVIGSKYDLTMRTGDTVPKTNRGHAAALIDLPDETCKKDLYMISAHFKSAGKPKDIKRRQQHADAIISWIRDIKEQGGNIDLPEKTPIVILGDFNVYDTDPHHHLTTLITGDIEDEKTYGPDIAPDWDSTNLLDALPVQNGKGNLTYTWRNDTGQIQSRTFGSDNLHRQRNGREQLVRTQYSRYDQRGTNSNRPSGGRRRTRARQRTFRSPACCNRFCIGRIIFFANRQGPES